MLKRKLSSVTSNLMGFNVFTILWQTATWGPTKKVQIFIFDVNKPDEQSKTFFVHLLPCQSGEKWLCGFQIQMFPNRNRHPHPLVYVWGIKIQSPTHGSEDEDVCFYWDSVLPRSPCELSKVIATNRKIAPRQEPSSDLLIFFGRKYTVCSVHSLICYIIGLLVGYICLTFPHCVFSSVCQRRCKVALVAFGLV